MRRAEIRTVSGGPHHAGKPRPAVIIQDDRFDTDSVTLCPFTTDPTEAPLFRLDIEPSDDNGPRESSRLMVDKITMAARTKLGSRIGVLEDAEMVRLNRAAAVVLLGVASTS